MAPSPLLTVRGTTDPRAVADVEIVIPVFNEEAALEASVRRLHRYLTEQFPLSWQVTIADNASRDQTWGIACRLANELGGVSAVHLDDKGRGRALQAAWSASTAAVVAYMDVDLSTDLDALLPLVAPLLSGHSDVAIGTRLAPGSRVVRGPEPRADLAQLQPHPQGDPAQRLLRRPVRLQGGAGRRGPRPAAAHRGQRLVLRHRAARAGRAQRPADPRGPGRLGRRRRLPGPRVDHRARRPAGDLADGPPPGRRRGLAAPRRPGRQRPGAGTGRPAGPLRRDRRRHDRALCRSLRRCWPVPWGRSGPTSSPSASAPPSTSRPTGGSPSPSGAGPDGPGSTRRRAWSPPCPSWRRSPPSSRSAPPACPRSPLTWLVLTLVNAAVAVFRFVLLRRWVFAPASGPGRRR